MLSAPECSPVRSSPREAGFTLVELLVAMAAGLLVMIAATTILFVTMDQTQRTFTRIDATRQARTAFGYIENELHSACVNGSPPIEGVAADGTVESDANDLDFLSYTGNAANPTPVWHQLSYSATLGTLTDTSYSATYTPSVTGNDWTRGSSIATTPCSPTCPRSRAAAPVFQYFAYQSVGTVGGNSYYAIPDGSNVSPLTGATLTPRAARPRQLAAGGGRQQDRRGCRQPARRPQLGEHRQQLADLGRRCRHRLHLVAADDSTRLFRRKQLERAVRTMPVSASPTTSRSEATLRARLRSEGGFTMLLALGVLMVTMLLGAAVFAAVKGDAALTRTDLNGKQAYAAAQAGVQSYLYQLNSNASNSAWWENCANDTAGQPPAKPGLGSRLDHR